MVEFIIPGDPRGKARPRVVRTRDGRAEVLFTDCPAKKKSHNYPEEFSKPQGKTRAVPHPPVGLDQALKDLKKYNAEHGTLLSYGQYMAMFERK